MSMNAPSPMPVMFTSWDLATKRPRLMPESPSLPVGSGNSDSFGAAGNGRPSAQVDAAAARRPVIGALTAVGILIAFRLIVEFAEDVT